MFSKAKSGADQFFASHIAASLAVALLWVGQFRPLPDFMAGLAAGMILAASAIMFLFRARDEYTLSVWHAGTSAGFAAVVIWLVADSFTRGFDMNGLAGSRLPVLIAMTAYLVTVTIKWVEARA